MQDSRIVYLRNRRCGVSASGWSLLEVRGKAADRHRQHGEDQQPQMRHCPPLHLYHNSSPNATMCRISQPVSSDGRGVFKPYQCAESQIETKSAHVRVGRAPPPRRRSAGVAWSPNCNNPRYPLSNIGLFISRICGTHKNQTDDKNSLIAKSVQ